MKNNVKSASLKKANRSRAMSLVVFLGPFLLVFFVFTILPVLVSILVSLTNFNMLEMPGFVGLDNYAKLFLNDSVFTTAIQNTMIISVITLPALLRLCMVGQRNSPQAPCFHDPAVLCSFSFRRYERRLGTALLQR